MKRALLASALVAVHCFSAHAQFAVERPPQFVLMAFDNCTELERWQEWSDFAAGMNRDSDRVHFTFFVSGVNFIANANRGVYEGPRQRRGAASINFGGTADDVRRRVEYINALRRSGHEIASHAVGHFNGSGWSAADWAKEFHAFNEVAAKVGPNNGFGDAVKLAFPLTDVRGFRAPYLAKSAGLFTTLRNAGFRYDTSGVGHAQAWPQKIDGVWRFDLVNLRISGQRQGHDLDGLQFPGRAVRRLPEPRCRRAARNSATRWFRPISITSRPIMPATARRLHIGHHFSDYQHGAYREALQDVCAHGLRAAGGALHHLCAACRLHGCAAPRHACGLSQGRFPARGAAGHQACRDGALTMLRRPGAASLPAEHRAFARHAPVIAGELAALADHAVARHDEADRVLADCGADGARRLLGCADLRWRCRNRW